MNIIIPCHAWAKSKDNNPFFHTPSLFQGAVLFVPWREHGKHVLNTVLGARCRHINIPARAPFDYLWAFGACTPCQWCDTTKTKSKPCQGLSLYVTCYKYMQGIKTCSFDTRLEAQRRQGSSTQQNNRLRLSQAGFPSIFLCSEIKLILGRDIFTCGSFRVLWLSSFWVQ